MLNDKAKNFCKYLGIAKARGFDPLVVLTHAWHESAGFTRIIGVSNVWGIKAPSDVMRWNGLVVERWTHEDERVRDEDLRGDQRGQRVDEGGAQPAGGTDHDRAARLGHRPRRVARRRREPARGRPGKAP
jgi:hypothetical protein